MLPLFTRQVAAALGGTTISAIGSTPSAVIGQTITVNIQIGAVADLYALQFDLSFAPKLLSVVCVSRALFSKVEA